jgi:hypothetical protein
MCCSLSSEGNPKDVRFQFKPYQVRGLYYHIENKKVKYFLQTLFKKLIEQFGCLLYNYPYEYKENIVFFEMGAILCIMITKYGLELHRKRKYIFTLKWLTAMA